MTSKSEFFEIKAITNSGYGDVRYSVSWPNRGVVSAQTSLMTIWNIAFETGAWKVGFANSSDCLWVDRIIFEYSDPFYAWELLKRISVIDQVVFETHDYAEKFVYEMEKQITFKLLSREYDYVNGGG